MRLFLTVSVLGMLILGVAWLYQPGTSLEEIQTGGLAQVILTEHALPLEFAATNLVGAVGFFVGGYSLFTLRIGFILFGLAAIAYLASVLFRQERNPLPVGCLFVAVAATPMMAGFISHADEICFGFSLSILLLALLVSSSRGATLPLILAQLCVASALAYEYVAYKFFLLLLTPLIVTNLVRYGRARRGVSRWIGFVVIGGVTLLLLAPLVSHVLSAGADSFVFDGLRRHFASRGLGSEWSWESIWSRAIRYYLVVLGIGSGDPHLSGEQAGLWHWSTAAVLLISCAITARTSWLARICLIHVLVAPLLAAILARNVEPLRMGASLAGVVVGGLMGVSEVTRPSSRGWWANSISGIGIMLALLSANMMPALGSSHALRVSHAHDNYPLCHLLGSVWREAGDAVQLYAFDDFAECSIEGEDNWIVPEGFQLHRRATPSELDASSKGAVVFAKRYGMSTEQERFAQEWAREHGYTVRWVHDLAGRRFAAVLTFNERVE